MQPLRPLAPSRCLLTRTPLLALPIRSFSTTPAQCRQTPTHLTVPKEKVPDYPYGDYRWYKQRNSGLYGQSKIRFGNTVSQPRQIKVGTHWKPNRHTKRLWSPALNMFIRTRLTANVLKTVDKLGGIDNYLLGTKAARVRDLGPAGWRLRWKVMQSAAVQEQWAREREELGLPPGPVPYVGGGAGGPVGAEQDLLEPEGMAELDGMLEREEEFVLGDPGYGDAAEGEVYEAEAPEVVEDPKSQEAEASKTKSES